MRTPSERLGARCALVLFAALHFVLSSNSNYRNHVRVEAFTPHTSTRMHSTKNVWNSEPQSRRRQSDVMIVCASSIQKHLPKLSDLMRDSAAGMETAKRETRHASKNPENKSNAYKYINSTQNRDSNSRYPPSQSYRKRNKVYDQTEPWRANFMVSSLTQRRIQDAAKTSSYNDKNPSLSSPIRVLDALLATPAEECNEVNVMCALTLSTKTIMQQIIKMNGAKSRISEDVVQSQLRDFKEKLSSVLQIFTHLLENKRLNFRQMANAAWSMGKLLQLFQSCSIFEDDEEYPTQTGDATSLHLEKVLLLTAHSITEYLSSEVTSSTSSATTGEIAMMLWAFSTWKPKVNPTGWMWPPTDARMPLQQKTALQANMQLGKKAIVFERHAGVIEEGGPRDSKGSSASNNTIQLLMDAVAETLLKTIDSDREENVYVSSANNDVPEQVRRVLGHSSWSELSNVAYAYARSQYGSSLKSEALMKEVVVESIRRLSNTTRVAVPLPWDLSLIAWSLGVMQVANYGLGDSLQQFLDAVVAHEFTKSKSGLKNWNSKDVVQLSIALAHSAIDNRTLLDAIFRKATMEVDSFRSWELTVLLWVQAKLYLTSKLGDVYSRFTTAAVACLHQRMQKGGLFANGIGSQEQANLAWSLTVLEEYTTDSIDLLRAVFAEASSENSHLTLEHAHQLWQALFLLKSECPEAVDSVPKGFTRWLEERWKEEKARKKVSSARHKALSNTLKLMRVAHYNEHDEDIDVAIVLKAKSGWTSHAAVTSDDNGRSQYRIGMEVDGPSHFVNGGKRALGHTVLKYRLLKQQGWVVVRVPYYEFDKIPFWASMERQRYLQRLLKTHPNLKFSGADVSEYKALVFNRKSRYD